MASSAGTQDPQPSIEELLATRLSVTELKIQGATRTKAELLNRIIRPVLSTGGTFEGVVEDVSQAVDRLRSTNCYRGVDAYLDTTTGGDASVVFTLAEKGWYQIHTGTSIETSGERDASVEGSFLFRNVRGSADTLRASMGWGGSGAALAKVPSTSWDVEYIRPFAAGLDTSAFAGVKGALHNHEAASSYSLHTRRGEVGLSSPAGTVSLLTAWREVGGVDSNASSLIREDAGHTWVTAFKHMMTSDTRDHPPMPTTGSAASLTTEIAMPVGDTSYTKFEGGAQVHTPIAGGSLAISARSGLVISNGRTRLPDRFFLGGANSFRGFSPRGLGPRDGNDALGGDLFYTLTGMFSLPLPASSLLSQMFNARMHVFGCAGDLTELGVVKEGIKKLREVRGAKEVLRRGWEGISGSARATVGLGVALETSLGRVEINFCQAMRIGSGDKVRAGVQVGISESFS